MDTLSNNTSDPQLVELLHRLDGRLRQIEQRLDIETPGELPDEESPEIVHRASDGESLEVRIGRDFLPKMGIIVFSFGMVFLLTFPLKVLPVFVANTLGFVIAGVFLGLSRFLSKSLAQFSRYLTGGGLLLLFFAVLRLHYFSADPVIESNGLEIFLLSAVIVVSVFTGIRLQSPYLVSIGLTMGYVAFLTAGNAYVIFAFIALLSVIGVYLALKYEWLFLLPLGVIASFMTHLIWSLNTPIFGNPLVIVGDIPFNLYAIILYALIFGAGILLRKSHEEKDLLVVATFFNTALPLALLLYMTLSKYPEHMGVVFVLIAILYLGLADGYWRRHHNKISVYLYAMAGNMALSTAIITQIDVSHAFLWLCLQSFLVISFAIWFRSRFIVVTNFMLFVGVFIAYLAMAETIGGTALVFGFVAILSARIMNWQKSRLELKADMLRGAYLLTALFIIPYGLYHIVPTEYVGLAWAGVSIGYYMLSRLLDNYKYRWMALTTLLMTVVYLIFIGLGDYDPVYRVVSFIVLGVLLLVISIYYTRMSAKSGEEKSTEPAVAKAPPEAN